MPVHELRKRLLEKVAVTESELLLKEAIRLLDAETEMERAYVLNEEQKDAVQEARRQIQSGVSLTDAEADAQTDAWLDA